MNESNTLSIGEVAAQTGLTERALRLYEEEGLVKPARTSAGRRVYQALDLEALAQVRLLKKAGFTIAQMKSLMGGSRDVARLIEAQLHVLREKALQINGAVTVLTSVQRQLVTDGDVDAQTLCMLIKAGECEIGGKQWRDVYERYFSAAEEDKWGKVREDIFRDVDPEAYEQAWGALARKIAAALPLDPKTARAQIFLEEWEKLLEPLVKVTSPEMMENLSKFWRDIEHWKDDVDQPVSPSVIKFIMAAKAAREKHIGKR